MGTWPHGDPQVGSHLPGGGVLPRRTNGLVREETKGFSSWSSIRCKREAEEHREVQCAGEGVRRRGMSHVVQGLNDSD